MRFARWPKSTCSKSDLLLFTATSKTMFYLLCNFPKGYKFHNEDIALLWMAEIFCLLIMEIKRWKKQDIGTLKILHQYSFLNM